MLNLRLRTFAFALCLLAVGATSTAQDLEINRWRPATSLRYDMITLDSARADLERGYELGLWLEYNDDPLVSTREGEQVDKLVSGQMVAHIALAVEVADRLRFALDVPAYIFQNSDAPLLGRDLSGGGIGDIGITPKLELYDGRSEGGSGVGLAVLAPVLLPTGNGDRLQGEGFRVSPTLALDWGSAGGFTIAANLGATVAQRTTLGNIDANDEFNWGLGVDIPLGSSPLDLIGELVGSVPINGGITRQEVPVEAMGMLRAGLGPVVAGIGGGAGLREGWGAPDFRVFGMVGYSPLARPAPPAPIAQIVEPPSDRDGDGILDEDDACPDDPEDFDGIQDEDGCPEDDADGDGILDEDDECPLQPEDFDGWQDEDGCPDPDNDGDGILDVDDQCPGVDGDAMIDVREVYNGFEDEDGCPDVLAELTETHIQLNGVIYFDLDSDLMQARSRAIIDEVARILEAHPEVLSVEVAGHTDSRGTEAYNADLSQRRTETVVRALRERGVERSRLTARGYGERELVDQGTTEAAHQRNRRVEFRILERAEPEPPAAATPGAVEPQGDTQ